MPSFDMSAAYGDGGAEAGDPAPQTDAPRQAARDRPPRPRDRFGRPRPRGEPDEMAHAEEPGDVVASLEQAFERAVALFDAERFFEAHEFFEHIWKSDWVEPADTDFWKGVTQVAVGCCHLQRGNDTGALSLLQRATRYLAAAPASHHGVDVSALIAAADDIADQARQRGASAQLDFPRFPRAG